jgi:hypothetical protein
MPNQDSKAIYVESTTHTHHVQDNKVLDLPSGEPFPVYTPLQEPSAQWAGDQSYAQARDYLNAMAKLKSDTLHKEVEYFNQIRLTNTLAGARNELYQSINEQIAQQDPNVDLVAYAKDKSDEIQQKYSDMVFSTRERVALTQTFAQMQPQIVSLSIKEYRQIRKREANRNLNDFYATCTQQVLNDVPIRDILQQFIPLEQSIAKTLPELVPVLEASKHDLLLYSIKRIADKNPHEALDILNTASENNIYNALTFPQRESALHYIQSKAHDIDHHLTLLEQSQYIAQLDDENSTTYQLQQGILTGQAGYADVLAAYEAGNINKSTYQRMTKGLRALKELELRKAATNIRIEQQIQQIGFSSESDSHINDYFLSKYGPQVTDPETGQPQYSLYQRAQFASDFFSNTKIRSISTEIIKNANSNDIVRMGEALDAFCLLNEKSPAVIKDITGIERKKLNLIASYRNDGFDLRVATQMASDAMEKQPQDPDTIRKLKADFYSDTRGGTILHSDFSVSDLQKQGAPIPDNADAYIRVINRICRDAYIQTGGNKDTALRIAAQSLKSIFRCGFVNGQEAIDVPMLNEPSLSYPNVPAVVIRNAMLTQTINRINQSYNAAPDKTVPLLVVEPRHYSKLSLDQMQSEDIGRGVNRASIVSTDSDGHITRDEAFFYYSSVGNGRYMVKYSKLSSNWLVNRAKQLFNNDPKSIIEADTGIPVFDAKTNQPIIISPLDSPLMKLRPNRPNEAKPVSQSMSESKKVGENEFGPIYEPNAASKGT